MSNRITVKKSIISCCLIFLISGCGSNLQNNGGNDQSGKKDSGEDKTTVVVDINSGDRAGQKIIPVVPGPNGPSSVSVPPGPTPFGGGTGGGSQGALKPIDLGNSDEDDEENIPEAVCGNGKQEAYAGNPNCPFDIYGVATPDDDDGIGYLVGFETEDQGQGGFIAQIGPDFHNVTDIDFSPDGTLYGVADDNNGSLVLITIDCRTAQASLIGPLNVVTFDPDPKVTDISFDSFGRLWAYVTDNQPSQKAGYIDLFNGQFFALPNPTGLTDIGNGLGTTPFPSDNLYDAGDAYLSIINRTSGIGTHLYTLNFSAPADDNPLINGLDGDPLTQIFYASIEDGVDSNENYLGTLDINSGDVAFLVTPPYEAPDGLNGIAVNRRYEECDPLSGDPVIPDGTNCTDDCQVVESNCFDGLDNDDNGLIDCQDPACEAQTCNDGNGCTDDDTCEEGTCSGTTVTCDIQNECLTGTCVPFVASPNSPAGNDQYYCSYSPDPTKETFGSCTPSDNCDGERNPDGTCPPDQIIDLCEVGKCVQETCPMNNTPPEIECEGQPKALVPIATCFINNIATGNCVDVTNSSDCPNGTCRPAGGCLDTNPCTADGCEEDDGDCEYGYLENVLCDDGNDCTTGDECRIVIVDEDIDDDTEPTVSAVCQSSGTVSNEEFCSVHNNDSCNGRPGSCFNGSCVVASSQCATGDLCVVSECRNIGPGPSGPVQCTPVTNYQDGTACSFGTCNTGTCLNGICQAQPNNSVCLDESCLNNPCLIPECTEGGCETQFADGEVPCGSGPCVGFQTCEDGVAIGDCDPTDDAACDD